MPEDETTPTPTTAPVVTDTTGAAEIARLNGLLADAQAETARLREQVQTLEGQVDQTKQQELEARQTALEAENAALKEENGTLKADTARAAQLAALTGKVRDPEAALKLLTDDLKGADGQPSVEAIIARYPYLAPEGVTVATAPNGAGGVQAAGATSLDSAIASKDSAAINAAMDAELNGGK